ncbi:amphiphysin-like [Dendronephthya gigantea]|uniref:amphiphysin-like n=1 Tax=Dendronephthya gigantea TaxID=151771 RepID=UPI001069AF5B|nr:amphiphysin-like [Dendronephthya gigantea]
MADKASGDKAGEKNFFARTAKNTTKRAKRAQEKVKRKLGKSDETKDEIFDRFVDNFNKQQDAVQRLQKELKNYINCLKAMLNANQLFGEAVKQVYEPDWSGREKFVKLLDTLDHSWTNLVQQLQDEVLEPLTSYQVQFPETKIRIAKRSRKVVDYDRHRHHLETLKVKGGKTGEPKKLSQAEEDYNQAKNAYLQLHSDLYEELPALYDSRISIYVSSFQSIFTAEGVFHRETSKIKTEMNDLLDVLAKETSAGAYSTRRPLSGISNISSDGDSSPENFVKCDQNDGKAAKEDNTDENSENETSENGEANDEIDKVPPDRSPAEVETKNDIPPPRPPAVKTKPVERPPSPNIPEVVDTPESIQNEEKTESTDTTKVEDTSEIETGVTSEKDNGEHNDGAKDDGAKDDGEKNDSEKEDGAKDDGPRNDGKTDDGEKEKDVEEKQTDVDLSRVLYKVEATHPYTGEDDDELTFEKGDVIQVIPYTENDDPDEGWLLGVLESTRVKGVFPENFTKRVEE